MRMPHTFERIGRAIAHARFSIVSVGIAYIVGLLFGALMVHAGSAFALRFRDRMVTDAQQTSPILASGRNVILMVLDTEVYSNTGGQASKSTPRAAVAKFAAGGKAVAVESGQWLLYRYNPERALVGENPLALDSRTPTRKVKDFLEQQARFKMLTKSKPEDAKRLWAQAQHDADIRFGLYEYLAQRKIAPEAPVSADPLNAEHHNTLVGASEEVEK